MAFSTQTFDDLFRDKVRRARAMTLGERLLAGPRMFDAACRGMAHRLREYMPQAMEEDICREVAGQIELLQNLDAADSVPNSIEDVILIRLLSAWRGRNPELLEDAKIILRALGSSIDFEYLHAGCDLHGTRELLDTVRKSD